MTMKKIHFPELGDALCRASELKLRKQRSGILRTSSSGIDALDRILGGGWPCATFCEINGKASSGRFAMLLSSLRHGLSTGASAALIDQGNHLDPRKALELGLDLERLLWVRPDSLNDSLSSAEMLLDAGFPLIVIDLGLSPVRGRVSAAAWLRLARLGTEHQALILLGSPYRISGCAAGMVLNIHRQKGHWIGRSSQMCLLEGIRNHIEILKNPRHEHCSDIRLRFDLPEADFQKSKFSENISMRGAQHA